MSLDTKFRPIDYDDVLGQETYIKILRRFIVTGTAFCQSYLFAGPFGSGKTTLGRILARALLCDSPTPTGDPCNVCSSCRSLIDSGTCMDFVEIDAATNSGKDEIRRITEEIQYATFSGRRRVYLFDESHQLSRDALDAMLKPMEENVPGTQDKKLVCIFCTTEPEKMRATILSRCAAAFIIQPVSPELIAKRLEMICQKENIPYSFDALVTMAEVTECHIRDAIKAVEGVSMLGEVNLENAGKYLKLDLNTAYLDILDNIGVDLGAAMKAVRSVLERTSPVSAYEKLADVALLSYQVALGAIKPFSFWDTSRLAAIGQRNGEALLEFVNRFASRPGRPTAAMLMCDVGHLHHSGGKTAEVIYVSSSPMPAYQVPLIQQVAQESSVSSPISVGVISEKNVVAICPPSGTIRGVHLAAPSAGPNGGGVHVDRRAVHKRPLDAKSTLGVSTKVAELNTQDFCRMLAIRLTELDEANDGSTRRFDMDSRGIDPTGRNPS